MPTVKPPVDYFVVGKTPIFVNATPEEPSKIFATAVKVFYGTTNAVTTGNGTEIALNASYTTEVPVWLVSESNSQIIVEHLQAVTQYDDTITEKLAVTGTTTVTGGIVANSGPPGVWAGGYAPVTAETGTDTACAEKKLFTTSLFLPYNKKLKGIGYLLGAGGGTTRMVAALFNSAGEVLAKSTETSEGTVAGTEKTIQELAFTSEYSAIGPASYFIGVTGNGATAHVRTIPTNTAGENIQAAELTLASKNTIAKITPPTTFTGGKGVVGFVY